MDRRSLLQKPDEQSRLLRQIPYVIAEEVKKVEPKPLNLPDLEQQGYIDSPTPIIEGASKIATHDEKENNSPFWVPSVPNVAASAPSTFIHLLQTNKNQGNVGISISVPEGASGIPIGDDVAKGNSYMVSPKTVPAENHDIPILATESIQASIRVENNETALPLNLEDHNVPFQAQKYTQASIGNKNDENHDVPIQAPENIQTTIKNENNGTMLSLDLNVGTPAAREVIELSDDEEEEISVPVVLNPPLREDLQCKDWHYFDPQGDVQGPFTLGELKLWWDAEFFPLDFKVWKGHNLGETAYLIDIIRTVFPK
ncbi:hypothetical protein ACFE04_013635 [Oxalis oulophora]